MLEIKQLDSLQTTPRSMKSTNGEDITYNLEILQWCLNNAPQPVLLDIMDNLVDNMWDSYTSICKPSSKQPDVKDVVRKCVLTPSSVAIKKPSYRTRRIYTGFCILSTADPYMGFRVSTSYSREMEFKCRDFKVLITTDLIDYDTLDPYSKTVKRNLADIYCMHILNDDTLCLIAARKVVKDGVTYYRGFRDEQIKEMFANDEDVLKAYLGYPYEEVTTYTPLQLLENRMILQKLVLETSGVNLSNLLVPSIEEVYSCFGSVHTGKNSELIFEPERYNVYEKSFDKAYFTTDTVNMFLYDKLNPVIDIEYGVYYLYAVQDGIPCFIAQTIDDDGKLVTDLKGFNRPGDYIHGRFEAR